MSSPQESTPMSATPSDAKATQSTEAASHADAILTSPSELASSSDSMSVSASVLPRMLDDSQASNLTSDAYALQEQFDHFASHISQLQNQLRQSQKLATLGATAAMIAHEFNNLFTPVVAYARHALDTDDVALMRKALSKTLTQTAVMREMADRVIGLAKPSDGAITSVNVENIVKNAISCLGRDLTKDNISVNLQIDPELAVRANENKLLQVLFNLVINARQAMLGRRGRLAIDAVATRDGKVQINVRDTGGGIPAEKLEQIFEPFFTTKQNAQRSDQGGLGLGLTICSEIMEELDGQIDVSSEAGVGTTFVLTLPPA